MAMSQTKDDLLKHLNMSQETYTMLAKETDQVYKWLTSDKRHLKKNCKRKPPYDWSDIVEKSKDEAMARIAQSSDPHTSYYWNLAVPTEDCPNWIARWFLYHKFRYRDGRNRNPTRGEDEEHTHSSSSRHSHHDRHKHAEGAEESNVYYGTQDPYYTADYVTADQDPQGYDYSGAGSASMPNGYAANGYASQTYQYNTSAGPYKPKDQGDGQAAKGYWDPVRDV